MDGGGSANAAASLPVLSDADIAHAIALIHAALGSPSPSSPPNDNGTPAIDQATAQTQLIALQSLPSPRRLVPHPRAPLAPGPAHRLLRRAHGACQDRPGSGEPAAGAGGRAAGGAC
ncbi:hypothetical protein C8J57DRAFT_1530153 [Mycena rebaudengoi]|nr:hypothetical protein C8J57DRAFT_1530153 [Mycena rebaudengoi]